MSSWILEISEVRLADALASALEALQGRASVVYENGRNPDQP